MEERQLVTDNWGWTFEPQVLPLETHFLQGGFTFQTAPSDGKQVFKRTNL